MKTLNDYILEYHKHVKMGDVQKAYQGLMKFLLDLKTYLKDKHSDYSVSGNISHGQMDVSYFFFTPQKLKELNLKIAIVYVHEKNNFEVWLTGTTLKVRSDYWKTLKEKDLGEYRISSEILGLAPIVEHDLMSNPDFDNLNSLTKQIENGTIDFIKEIESFLTSII